MKRQWFATIALASLPVLAAGFGGSSYTALDVKAAVVSSESGIRGVFGLKSPAVLAGNGIGSPARDEQEGAYAAERTDWKPLGLQSLNVQSVSRSNGFRLVFDGPGQPFVKESFAWDGSESMVHIVRRYENVTEDGSVSVYRQDAVIVRPDSRQIRVVPLINATIRDVYSVDSIAGPAGFAPDGRLVVVAVVADSSDDSAFRYRIEAVDLVSGASEVLLDRVPDDVSPDFFAARWLGGNGSVLLINSYRDGKLWRADLSGKSVRFIEGRFSHAWPLFHIVPSPSGDRFWYENRLYDLNGRVVAEAKHEGGMEQHPAYIWNPEGTYTVYMYTDNENEEAVLVQEDGLRIIAPQNLHVMDRDGKTVAKIATGAEQGMYADVIGWLEQPDAAIVAYYRLGRCEGSEPRKTAAAYKLLDMKSRTLRELQRVTSLAELNDPVWVTPQQVIVPPTAAILALERESGLFWSFEQPVAPVPGWTKEAPLWISLDRNGSDSALYQYDDASKSLRTVTPGHVLYRPVFNGRWLFEEGDAEYFALSGL
ncbi:hypothetical protein [Paenibacillus ginsengarvi]|uniref:Copper amine oxidase-like N-terminal domain-containing protein n=1 Tax=Paenibacillus ginsengarvi TaxID=400777 RepID=A0A3B0CII1_9BACL|nr:hypothetical protein [Paenibacillus ginsengarvi]RKN83786.1 hypothetical protein D7M11_16450 [Paenibacillus ginsengarvi]